jgi:serine protease inhibitor
MRWSVPRPLSTSLLACAVLVAACAERSPVAPGPGTDPGPEPVRPLTTQEQRVAGASVGFGLALLRQVHGAEAAPNLLVSPLSASMALGLTMNGAVGATYDAMRATLGFDGLSEAEINAAYRGLIAQLRARDPKVEFGLANSAWYERSFAVKAPFLEAAREHFDAEVQALDFLSPEAPKTISAWAEQKTGGRIRDLVQEIDPLEKLFLVNAVYFKAPWTRPFMPQATREGDFTRLDGSTARVPLMVLDAVLLQHRDAELQAVELLYADSAYSMVLVAPAAGHSLAPLAPLLTPERWQALLAGMQAERIHLTLPKFRFDYATELSEPLRALGMGIAFRPFDADFSRIADRDDLHITRVEQKAFIDVHELGTEAAAATAVGVGVTSVPPELRFNRPYLFAIRERSTGTLLFTGRVGDPGAH